MIASSYRHTQHTYAVPCPGRSAALYAERTGLREEDVNGALASEFATVYLGLEMALKATACVFVCARVWACDCACA